MDPNRCVFIITIVSKFSGIPLDQRHTYSKTDWSLFLAAALHSTHPQGSSVLIKSIYDYLAGGKSDAPLPDWFETTNGVGIGFRARPVVGGHFAPLALLEAQRRRSA